MSHQLRVKIVGSRTDVPAKGKPFTVYLIEVVTTSERFSVSRRYNEFDDFKNEIEAKYPATRNARKVFPGKTFFRSNMSPTVIQERKEAFETYLNRIITDAPDLVQSAEFLHFVCDEPGKKLVPSPQEEVKAATPVSQTVSAYEKAQAAVTKASVTITSTTTTTSATTRPTVQPSAQPSAAKALGPQPSPFKSPSAPSIAQTSSNNQSTATKTTGAQPSTQYGTTKVYPQPQATAAVAKPATTVYPSAITGNKVPTSGTTGMSSAVSAISGFADKRREEEEENKKREQERKMEEAKERERKRAEEDRKRKEEEDRRKREEDRRKKEEEERKKREDDERRKKTEQEAQRKREQEIIQKRKEDEERRKREEEKRSISSPVMPKFTPTAPAASITTYTQPPTSPTSTAAVKGGSAVVNPALANPALAKVAAGNRLSRSSSVPAHVNKLAQESHAGVSTPTMGRKGHLPRSDQQLGLIEWCKYRTQHYPEVNVKDFTKSWLDGLAFCAILHTLHPDRIDYDSLLKKSPAERLKAAFALALELGVPDWMDPEDLGIDRNSTMTYVAEVYNKLDGGKDSIKSTIKK